MEKNYMVLHRPKSVPIADPPLGYLCISETGGDATEQCLKTYPETDIVWIVQTASYDEALENYYGQSEEVLCKLNSCEGKLEKVLMNEQLNEHAFYCPSCGTYWIEHND